MKPDPTRNVESRAIMGADGSCRGYVRLDRDRIGHANETEFCITIDTSSYLSPHEARAFAQALERAAIDAEFSLGAYARWKREPMNTTGSTRESASGKSGSADAVVGTDASLTNPSATTAPRLGAWFYPAPSDAGYPWDCECGEPLNWPDVLAGYCPGCDREWVGTLAGVVRKWVHNETTGA